MGSDYMNSKELNKILIKKFPELERNYRNEVSWQEGDETGSHVVYGDVLNPYIIECISKENTNKLKEIFKFIEYLLDSGDDYASNVISVSVLESVLYTVFNDKKVFSLLGNKSRKVVEEFIKFDSKH